MSLRAFALDGVSADHHFQVVLVYAVERVADSSVFGLIAAYDVEQRPSLAMGDVVQAYFLALH